MTPRRTDEPEGWEVRDTRSTWIKVVGVGGGGGNAVQRMRSLALDGVELVAINTDAQALEAVNVPHKLLLGKTVTGGRGAGGNPDKGRAAALESHEEIADLIGHTHLLFITTTLGGGTGSGAAPIVADIARDLGLLTLGIVTRPFRWEGERRRDYAKEAILQLQEKIDALAIISNDRLMELPEAQNLPLPDAFYLADETLRKGVQGISDLLLKRGMVNRDLADIEAILRGAKRILLGTGEASGKDRAEAATRQALFSPLLEESPLGARHVLLNLTCGEDFTMNEMTKVVEIVRRETVNVDLPEPTMMWGATLDPQMHDRLRVTLLATGQTKAKPANAPIKVTQQKIPWEDDEGIDLSPFRLERFQ
ncbi:MAG: cell division protein FtsZ [bacterium]